MAEKGFGSLLDLASLFVDLMTYGHIKRGGETKQVVSPEQLETIKKTIVPKIFGAGAADEALFAAALAKLADRRQLEIGRFIDRLSAYDKKQFRLAIAILPDETDRIQVLNMYSELDDAEMMQVAKATGMISGGPGPLKKMGTKAETAALEIKNFMVGKLWPVIKPELMAIDQKAEVLAQKINHRVQHPGWFARLANKLIR